MNPGALNHGRSLVAPKPSNPLSPAHQSRTSMKGDAGFGLKMPVILVLPNDVLCFGVTTAMR